MIPKESSHDFYERYLNDFVSKLSLQIEDKENGNKVSKIILKFNLIVMVVLHAASI